MNKNIQHDLPPLDQDVVFHIDGKDWVGYLTMYCWEEQKLKIWLYGKLTDLVDAEVYVDADEPCDLLDVQHWRELAEHERKDGE